MIVNRISLPFPDATHIFDGLNDFPTHLVHMRFGSFVTIPTPWAPMGLNQPGVSASALRPLYDIALQWLKEDREFRQELEKQGQKMRGARRNEANMSQLWREFVLTDFSLLACAFRLGDILQKVSNLVIDEIIPERLSPDMITAISLQKKTDGTRCWRERG